MSQQVKRTSPQRLTRAARKWVNQILTALRHSYADTALVFGIIMIAVTALLWPNVIARTSAMPMDVNQTTVPVDGTRTEQLQSTTLSDLTALPAQAPLEERGDNYSRPRAATQNKLLAYPINTWRTLRLLIPWLIITILIVLRRHSSTSA